MKDTWWVDIGFQGARIRKRSPLNTKAGAMSYEATLRSKLLRGEAIESPKETLNHEIPTFGVFSLGRWFETYVRTNNKPSEQNEKMSVLSVHLVPFFGKVKLDRIKACHIEDYKALKLKKGLKPKTINNHLSVLSICLKTAIEWELMDTVLPRIRRLKVPQQPFDYLTPKECEQLLMHALDPFWQRMFLTAIKTGLRFGELLGLEWGDVDLERQMITVRRSIVNGIVSSPKSNRIRYVPLSSDVAGCLQLLWAQEGQPISGSVFSKTKRRPLNPKSMRRALERYCKAAGLRHVYWHMFRHTYASMLISQAVPVASVQALLGHSDIKTTMRYAHLYPFQLQKAVEVLEPNRLSQMPTFLRQPDGNRTKCATKKRQLSTQQKTLFPA